MHFNYLHIYLISVDAISMDKRVINFRQINQVDMHEVTKAWARLPMIIWILTNSESWRRI